MAPEPFADFVDLVAIGDGEELFPELIDRCRELRAGGASRAEVVSELGKVPGLYAPAHYTLATDPVTGMQIVTGSKTHPFPVKRRILMDLGRHPFPQDIIVPYCEIVHSRVAVEIMRGCNVGCRFCQAGYIYRPERIRSPDQVIEAALGSAAKTGFDEVSLTSLNTGEYPQIENVISTLMDRFEATTTSVSLPSLRASSLTGGLLDEVDRVRKSGLTIAPEGGTQRMRDVINKNITEADIENAATAAFSHGWDLIKLYFMIGQPTEREEDVVGIADTAKKVLGIGQKHRSRRARVNLGVSSFIPKAFTPFQWAPMQRGDELLRKQVVIRRALGRAAVKFGHHEVGQSLVEAALSRGDRRLGAVVLRAYRDGARFDGWTEHFNEARWRRAFVEEGLDLDDYAHRDIPLDAALPWDHVDIGVRKSYLADEWKRALSAATVTICAGSDCHGCGSFIKECLSGNVSLGREFPKRRARLRPDESPAPETFTWRAVHAKTGWLRFISHLDVQRTFHHAFRRADIEVAHTQGFHPLPRITFGPPLPLGFVGLAEAVDFTIRRDLSAAEVLSRLNAQLPPDLQLRGVAQMEKGGLKLSDLDAAQYVVALTPADLAGDDLGAAVERLMAQEAIPFQRVRKQVPKSVDLRPGILALSADGPLLSATLRVIGEGNARPDELVAVLLGRTIPRTRVTRERLVSTREGLLVDPHALIQLAEAAS